MNTDPTLREAYEIIFAAAPDASAETWQIAEAILDNFDVPKLGEDLARRCIFRIVNHVHYPDRLTTTRLVGRAESFATELWDDLPDEPHMADLEVKEYSYFSNPKGQA